jgi:hypothetical protein
MLFFSGLLLVLAVALVKAIGIRDDDQALARWANETQIAGFIVMLATIVLGMASRSWRRLRGSPLRTDPLDMLAARVLRAEEATLRAYWATDRLPT